MKVSDGIFIQVYDPNKKAWLTVCPVTTHFYSKTDRRSDSAVLHSLFHQKALADYLSERDILYIISAIQSQKFEYDCNTYPILHDIAMHLRLPQSLSKSNQSNPEEEEAQDDSLKKFFKAKNSCVLTPYVDGLIKQLQGRYSPLYPCDEQVRDLIKEYALITENLERTIIPETAQEFRNSLHYCVPS